MFSRFFQVSLCFTLVIITQARESETPVNDISFSSSTETVMKATHPPYPYKSMATHPPYPYKSMATHPPYSHSSLATHPPYPFPTKKHTEENPLKSFPTFTVRQWLKNRLTFFSPTKFVPLSNSKTHSSTGNTLNGQNFWSKFLQQLRNTLSRRNEQLTSKPKLSSNLFNLLAKLKLKAKLKQIENVKKV